MEETIRLIDAALKIVFEADNKGSEKHEREFIALSQSEDDAIGQWLRQVKGRGDTGDTDPVLLHLMVELYRKMDRLEQLVTHNAPHREVLDVEGSIESIGFEHFKLSEPILTPSEYYYGRVELPVHPNREIALYFEALDPYVGKITRMHPRDDDAWGIYMRARERAMIRHLKGHE